MENNLFFIPWEGINYNSSGIGNKKMLILGESHYCGEGCASCGNPILHPECTDFTQNVMTELISYYLDEAPHKYWMNTFTKFANLMKGDHQDRESLINFWNSVIFYNYVQIATDGPRISPSDENFKLSESAFFQVLEKYTPDLTIVWGQRLWELMPNDDNFIWESDTLKYYSINDRKYQLIDIYHPSATKIDYDRYEIIRRMIS